MELRVSITHYGPRYAMESHNLREEQIGYIGGIISLVASYEMGHFAKPIHHYRDIMMREHPLKDLSQGQEPKSFKMI